ncbi:MAG: hypothetical protein ACYTGZ_18090 [Planctomycetota bacterium]
MRALLALAILLVPALGEEQAWRSALYPEGWTPAFTDAKGQFLHDFSYAGYARGERALPDIAGPRFEPKVDATGKRDATAAIQQSIDAAAKRGGGVVALPPGLLRIDGTLRIRASGVVLRGAPTRLLFTKTRGLSGRANLMVQGKVRHGPDLRLAKSATVRATVVSLASVEGLAVGDRVALGLVVDDTFRAAHGMSKYWKFAAGKWRALFRREVTAIDKAAKAITLDIPLRYPLSTAHQASVRKETGYVTGSGIEDVSVCNAIDDDLAWRTTRVHAIELRDCLDCWVRRVSSFAASDGGKHLQSGGIRVRTSARVTVANCSLALPQHRGGGGNGYLFEIRQSGEVLTVDCKARGGRHNFIQNWDLGTSGCVWLRCDSREGDAVLVRSKVGGRELGITGLSEYHHALAMACLVDSCRLDDGWKAANRLHESSGAGHTATGCVFWNTTGIGVLRCHQFGTGYVIGTGKKLLVETKLGVRGSIGTDPEDFTEGLGRAAMLAPQSLYLDQLRRRLKR